jgi:hypothetical protein
MKTAIAGAVLTALSLSLPTVAATTDTFQFKGEHAYAFFGQSDGCSDTGVDVSVYDSVTRSSPGRATPQTEAYLYYYSYNYCTGTYSSGYGSSSNVTFTSNNQLSSATLNGTFSIYNYTSDTTKTANVALTWTGVGDTFRGSSHSRYQGPGYTSNERSVGSSRTAQVSGSVTVDGNNLISGLSGAGVLSSSNSGSVQISKR